MNRKWQEVAGSYRKLQEVSLLNDLMSTRLRVFLVCLCVPVDSSSCLGTRWLGSVRSGVPPQHRTTAHPPARPCGTSVDLREDHSRPLFTLVRGPFDSPPRHSLRPQTSSQDTRQDRQLTAAQIPKLERGRARRDLNGGSARCPVPAVLVVHTLCYILAASKW